MTSRYRKQSLSPTFQDLVETDLKTKQYRPVYLLVGEDSFRVESVVACLRDDLLGTSGAAFNYHLFQGEQAALETVLQQAFSFPMFAGRQVLWLRDIDKVSLDADSEKALLRYLEQPVDFSILLLSADKVDGRKRWVKKCRENGFYFDFSPPKGRDLEKWVRTAARRKGVPMPGPLAEIIIDLVGDDLHALAAEIDKLALVVEENPEAVSSGKLEEFIFQQRLGESYELTDALSPDDPGPALHVLQQQISWGRSVMELSPLLISRIRKVAMIAALEAEGLSLPQIKAVAGMHPYACQRLFETAQQLGQRNIERALTACHRCESTLKSSPIRPELVMERAILDICSTPGEKTEPDVS
ncbi:MAG: DNA polymerase III subunit delta [bacterium]